MTEPIHVRLDREVERLAAQQGGLRFPDAFIEGVQHAASIAHRMTAQVDLAVVTKALVNAWPDDDSNNAHFVVRTVLKCVATELGIDLDAALDARAEAVTEATS